MSEENGLDDAHRNIMAGIGASVGDA